MSTTVKNPNKADTFLKYLMAGIVLAGIVARLVVWFQNRNLIIDEANIARNLYERGFAGLVKPLDYEQYAPPVFLWIEKLNTLLFGFSEYALRLYPLITGIASLFVFRALLKKLMQVRAAWFPLLLFATSLICIRYSSEAKQYMPDVFICLSLLWLALTVDRVKHGATRFVLIWIIAGSVAIWSCMPSVFILAGISAYYGWHNLKNNNYLGLFRIVFISLVWLVQFALYYFTILEPQANSDYLQRFHQYSFLFATPGNAGEWTHNQAVVNALLLQFGSEWPRMLTIYSVFIIVGVIGLFRHSVQVALLLLVPVAGLLVAAALNQYSLMPRVALFSIPLFILLTGYGFSTVLRINIRLWKAAMVLLAVYASAGNIYKSCSEHYRYEQLTDGLRYIQEKGIAGDYLYLYWSSGPAFKYYTQIHPDSKQWESLANGSELLGWDRSYSSLSWEMQHTWSNTKPVAFIFTNGTDKEVYKLAQDMRSFMKEKARYDKPSVKVFIYQKN